MHGRVKIRHQAIAQFEILAADGLDGGIMKLTLIGIRRAAGVVRHLAWSRLAGIPTPRQPQMPRSPVRAKQRTESPELKPAHMQLAGVFLRGNEAADVRAPVRYSCQP